MKNQRFNGIENAEEIFFRSKKNEEETILGIKSEISKRTDGYDTSAGDVYIRFTKRRLFFCEYHINCEIQKTENRYRLRLFYTIDNTQWTYWLFGILTLVVISWTKILAKGDETTNALIFLGIIAFVLYGTYKNIYANPAQELIDSCNKIKKELEAYVKLELEP